MENRDRDACGATKKWCGSLSSSLGGYCWLWLVAWVNCWWWRRWPPANSGVFSLEGEVTEFIHGTEKVVVDLEPMFVVEVRSVTCWQLFHLE